MKNLFKSLMLVAVAAMAFTACQKDVDELNKVSEGTTVTFSANFGADTRATLTDEDNDGVFKAAWAEGDKVTFVAYNGEEYIENVEVEVAEAGATTEFTVNFKNTLAEGTVIKAFLNQYYDSYYERIDKYNSLGSQFVQPNIRYVYASAEAVYGGEAIGDLTFSHDVAYACMTLGCDCDEPCRFTYAMVTFTDVDGNSDYYTLYGDNAENNKFWFTAEAVANLAKLEVSAQDEYWETYEYVRVFEAGKALKAGVLYTFTVDAWATRLEQPEVEGTIDGTTATFTWTEDENATGYEVSVNNGEYVAVEGTEYTVDLTGYDPFASVNLRVKAKGDGALLLDSYDGYSSVTVPISKDAAGDEGYSFVYDQVEERGTNMYKFYNSTEKEYMYVKFSQDITTLEPGSYTYTLGNGVVSGTADSAFRHPTYDNGNYLEWWFQGDFMMFVDVTAEGAYTITTFCKRGIDYNGDWMNDAEPLYKSVWKGSFGVVEPEPEPEPEEVTIVSAVAKLVTDTTFNGYNPYDVVFTYSNGDWVTMRFNTSGNNYIVTGEWQNTECTMPNYISSVKYNYDNMGLVYGSVLTVDYVDGSYVLNGKIYSSPAIEFSYTGPIEGLEAPQASTGGDDNQGGDDSGDEGDDSGDTGSATQLTITSLGVGYNQPGERELIFSTNEGVQIVVNFKGMDNVVAGKPLVARTYSGEDYTCDTSYCIYGYGNTDIQCLMSAVKCTVSYDDNGVCTYDCEFTANDVDYAFVFTSNTNNY